MKIQFKGHQATEREVELSQDGDFLYQDFGGNTLIVPDETMEELLKNGVRE